MDTYADGRSGHWILHRRRTWWPGRRHRRDGRRELLALRGGREVLCRADAPVIVLELFDVNTAGFAYQALETWDYLEGFGYRMFEFDRTGRITGLAERPVDFSVERNLVARKASFRPKGPDRC